MQLAVYDISHINVTSEINIVVCACHILLPLLTRDCTPHTKAWNGHTVE